MGALAACWFTQRARHQPRDVLSCKRLTAGAAMRGLVWRCAAISDQPILPIVSLSQRFSQGM
jgi:hypothetical protein